MVNQVQSLKSKRWIEKRTYLENLLPVLGLDSEGLPDSLRNHSVVSTRRLDPIFHAILVVGRLSEIVQHRSRGSPVLVRKSLIQSLLQLGLLAKPSNLRVHSLRDQPLSLIQKIHGLYSNTKGY